jgi:hypothetical protein
MKRMVNAAYKAALNSPGRQCLITDGFASVTSRRSRTKYEIADRGSKEFTAFRDSKVPVLYGVKRLSNGRVLEYRVRTKTKDGYRAYFNAWDPDLAGSYRLTGKDGKVLVKRGNFASLEKMSAGQLQKKFGFTPEQFVAFQDSVSAP